MEKKEQYAFEQQTFEEYPEWQPHEQTETQNPLQLEAEPKPLFAILYFLNGKRLQVVGERGEIATFNLSASEHYTDLFCFLFSALCYERGSIYIREEHFAHLPPCFHPYFQPCRPIKQAQASPEQRSEAKQAQASPAQRSEAKQAQVGGGEERGEKV
jgi:hypothetical protein